MLNRPSTEERLGGHSAQSLTRYFIMLMATLYCCLGIFLIFAPPHMLQLPSTPRRLLGFVFIFYGIIRFVRVYRQHFQKSHDDQAR